ncbi:MAG: GntR family transcriptional regulator [Deinococcota bacterium]
MNDLRPTSLREQVVEHIRQAIVEGQLKPGDHMVEVQLTEQLGISRTPLREALILLEREGLVETIRHKGTYVRSFSVNDVDDIFSMRTTLENFAGERIIHELGTSDYSKLERLIDTQQKFINTNDFKRVRATDMDFHRYLVVRSGHPHLLRSWSEIVAQIAALLYKRAETNPQYDEAKVITDHQRILAAYKDRDIDALRQANTDINTRVAGECRKALS